MDAVVLLRGLESGRGQHTLDTPLFWLLERYNLRIFYSLWRDTIGRVDEVIGKCSARSQREEAGGCFPVHVYTAKSPLLVIKINATSKLVSSFMPPVCDINCFIVICNRLRSLTIHKWAWPQVLPGWGGTIESSSSPLPLPPRRTKRSIYGGKDAGTGIHKQSVFYRQRRGPRFSQGLRVLGPFKGACLSAAFT